MGLKGDPLGGIGVSQGGLAQLVEHLLCKQGVIGSNPIVSRNDCWLLAVGFARRWLVSFTPQPVRIR